MSNRKSRNRLNETMNESTDNENFSYDQEFSLVDQSTSFKENNVVSQSLENSQLSMLDNSNVSNRKNLKRSLSNSNNEINVFDDSNRLNGIHDKESGSMEIDEENDECVQRTKKPKNKVSSQINSCTESETDSGMDEEIYADCGTIQSIALNNFMCHDHFEISFSPRVNFVIGKNGSGKSAILTAVVIVLGGRATNTGRGQSLASFIKKGKQSAKISIKLCNYCSYNKASSFNFTEYGKSIIVERIIKSDSTSNYTLKSSSGKIISRKKEELNDIIRHFSIQIDNPVCILSQEVSRNFLNSKNPKDKYTFFMQATNLDQLKQAYASAMEQSMLAKEILQKKKSFLPQIEIEVKEMEKEVNIFTKLNKTKDKLTYLCCELLWSMVYKLQKEQSLLPKEIEELSSKISNCDEKCQSILNDNSELENSKENFENIKEEHLKKIEAFNDSKNKVNSILTNLRTSRSEKTFKMNEIKFNKNVAEQDKIKLDEKIKDIKDKIAQQDKIIAEQEKIKKKRDLLSQQQEDIRALNKEIKKNIEEKQNEFNTINDEIKSINYKTNRLRSELLNKENHLKNLNSNNLDSLAKFGSYYVKIVQLVDNYYKQGKFKQKPIGPLGHYIKLKNDDVCVALETCLKGLMFAFVCDNSRDAEFLIEITKNLNPQPPLMVLKRKFGPKFEIEDSLRINSFKSLLSYVNISNDQVYNTLLDKASLDKTLFIPNDNKAVELLINESIVPSNLKVAYSAVGTQFFPKRKDSTFKQYTNNKKPNRLLASDKSNLIEQLKNEIEEIKSSIKESLEKRVNLEHSAKQLNIELKNYEKELDSNDFKINNISRQFYELSSVKEFKPEDLSIFEKELEDYMVLIDKLQEDYNKYLDEFNKTEESLIQEKLNLNKIDKEIQEENESFENLLRDVKRKDVTINKNLEIMQKIEKRKEEFEARKKEREITLKKLEMKIDQAIERANQDNKEKIMTERDSDEIQKEIDELNNFLQENENRMGDREKLFEQYKERKIFLEKTESQIEFLEKHITVFAQAIKNRAKVYIILRGKLTKKTSELFTNYLQLLNFSGSLSVYHSETQVDDKVKKEKTLEIKINPKSSNPDSMYKDTKSLSGGERSFATIAFLLALWDSSYSPFNILDEVDVFMDMVTRHLALDALIQTANRKEGKQYIFLSPLPPEKKSINHLLKIFYMPEPNRVENH